MKNKYNQLLFECLIHAYNYYRIGESWISDIDYDNLTHELTENKTLITSKYKDLIDWEQFETCSTLFYINWTEPSHRMDYLRSFRDKWAKIISESV